MNQVRYPNKLEAVLRNINEARYADAEPVFSHGRLADEVGISRQAIAAIVKGDSVPTYFVAIKIYQALAAKVNTQGKKIHLLELFPITKTQSETEAI